MRPGQARCCAAREAFNAPFSVEMREIDALGMYDDAQKYGQDFRHHRTGRRCTPRRKTAQIARKGVRNLLIHFGILERRPVTAHHAVLSQVDDRCFHVTNHGGPRRLQRHPFGKP